MYYNVRSMKKVMVRWSVVVVVTACGSACFSGPAASALQSSNYRFDESAISTGNMLQSSSANYKALDGVNDLAIGTSSSSNYQVVAGSKTDPYPWLSFAITSSNANFGVLSPSTTATATATFSVLNYTSYGYIVQVTGSPPTNAGHDISPMTIPGSSQTGIEQFGLNLVANTSPISLGANPDNGQFGYGSVTSNYAGTNTYHYADGDIVAQAPKSSGLTNYTISYILNVTPLTPGGQYSTNQALIVTGTY